MVDVKGCVPGELDGVEGVDVAAGAAAAQVTVQNKTEVSWASSHGQVIIRDKHLEVLVFARGVEHGHLRLDGEQEALAFECHDCQ